MIVDMNQKRIIIILSFLFYIFTVLWYTNLGRETNLQPANLDWFWSYRKWFAGDMGLGKEILANIAMFIPFGFMASCIFPKRRFIVPAAMLFSLTIELTQFFFVRGLFELDDVFSNTVGAVVGIVLYRAMKKHLTKQHFSVLSVFIAVLCAVICFFVIFF